MMAPVQRESVQEDSGRQEDEQVAIPRWQFAMLLIGALLVTACLGMLANASLVLLPRSGITVYQPMAHAEQPVRTGQIVAGN